MITREEAQQVLDALEEIRYADISANQGKAIETLRTRLSAPEPEPHGYLWFTQYMEQRFTHRKPEERERIGDVKPLYTAPPQREWQGLTRSDADSLRVNYTKDGVVQVDALLMRVDEMLRERNT